MIKKISLLLITIFSVCLFTTVTMAFDVKNHQHFSLVKSGDMGEANYKTSGNITVQAEVSVISGKSNLALILCYDWLGGKKYVGRGDFSLSAPGTRSATWNNMKNHLYRGRIILASNSSNSPVQGEIFIGLD